MTWVSRVAVEVHGLSRGAPQAVAPRDRGSEWRTSRWMVLASGAWLIGLGAYFMILRPAFLPEDARYVGAPLSAMEASAPAIAQWLRRVFLVAGGFMVGTGLLTTFIAGSSQLWRAQSAGWALAFAGGPVVLMSAVNFDLGSEFRWLLVLPVLLWAVGVGCRAADR